MNRWILFVAVAAVVAAITAIAAPAQAASPRPWFWSTERAESVASYPESIPTNCERKIRHGWIGTCIAPTSVADCIGVGPRIIHQTDDVYLYKTFKCGFATKVWTPAKLNVIYRKMTASKCKLELEDLQGNIDAAAYSACVEAALRNKKKTAREGSTVGWFDDRTVYAQDTLRLEVLSRFTAKLTWRGWWWKTTIQPDDGSGDIPSFTK